MSKEMNLTGAVTGARASLEALKRATDAIAPKFGALDGALNDLPAVKSSAAGALASKNVKEGLESAKILKHTDGAFQAEVEASVAGAADAQAAVIRANDAVDKAESALTKAYEREYVPALNSVMESCAKLGRVHDGLTLLKSKVQFLNDRLTDTSNDPFDLDPWLLERLVHLSKKGGSSKSDKKALKTKVKKFLVEEENLGIKTAVDAKRLEIKSKGPGDDESVTSAVSSAGSDGGALGGASGLTPNQLMVAVAMFDINESFASVLGADKKVFDPVMITDALGAKARKASKLFSKKSASAADIQPSLKDQLEELKLADKKLIKGAKDDATYDKAINYLSDVMLPMEEWGELTDAPDWLVETIGKIKSGEIKSSDNVCNAVKALDIKWLNDKLTEASAAGKFKSPKKSKGGDTAAAYDSASDTESVVSLFPGKENNIVSTKDVLISVAVYYVNKLHNKLYAGKVREQKDPLGADTPKILVHPTKYSTEKFALKGVEKVVEGGAAAAPARSASEEDDAAAASAPGAKGKEAIEAKNNALFAKMDFTAVEEGFQALYGSEGIKPVDGGFPFDLAGEQIDAVEAAGAIVLAFDAGA